MAESKTKPFWLRPFAGLFFVAAACYGLGTALDYYQTERREKTEQQLSENAIYIPATRIYNDQIFGRVEDTDGNGTLESVLYIKNPVTDDYEKRLIELEGDKIHLREFEVVDGKIKYLDDCLK